MWALASGHSQQAGQSADDTGAEGTAGTPGDVAVVRMLRAHANQRRAVVPGQPSWKQEVTLRGGWTKITGVEAQGSLCPDGHGVGQRGQFRTLSVPRLPTELPSGESGWNPESEAAGEGQNPRPGRVREAGKDRRSGKGDKAPVS